MINNHPSYISLFSSAGVGCFGFKQAGFLCVATCELLPQRLNVQKLNHKCERNSAYIQGDLTEEKTKQAIYDEIAFWQSKGNDKVDVLIATPPCQGMSVLNQKKSASDQKRNSLVTESVEMIRIIRPKIFIFENVKTFWNTFCMDKNGNYLPIGEMMVHQLGQNYDICHRVLNFKDYGSASSRTRTLIIGVDKRFSSHIPPYLLFPDYQKSPTIRETIGNLKSLKWGEYDKNDFFHSFRPYPSHMQKWIENLKEGQSAFEQSDPERIPSVRQKMKDKFTRQRWDLTAPCIHTRNDQIASQNTIHPKDNRVFSIRELMRLMTIPDSFRWLDRDLPDLNHLSLLEKQKLSKKEELSIRRNIGESVPTVIFKKIAQNIVNALAKQNVSKREISQLIQLFDIQTSQNMLDFVQQHQNQFSLHSFSMLIEQANTNRERHQAYFSKPDIIAKITADLPDFNQDEMTILEPAAGCGNFVPFLFRHYAHIPKVNVYLMDIDPNMVNILKVLYEKGVPSNFNIHFINGDFLTYHPDVHIDLIVGNPPFGKQARQFLQKASELADWVSFIMPKSLLNTPDYGDMRKSLQNRIVKIWDFGEKAFDGILIETVNVLLSPKSSALITIENLSEISKTHRKSYIFDVKLPYWVIYRNDEFDSLFNQMEFGKFKVFRDRQIRKSLLSAKPQNNHAVRVLKSRNIGNDGTIQDVDGYDAFILAENAEKLAVWQYLERDDVYMIPNMSMKPRMIKKDRGYLVNGSVALLIPKQPLSLNQKQMDFIASDEFKFFYFIARNKQTRSLNIDALSVFWFGILKE